MYVRLSASIRVYGVPTRAGTWAEAMSTGAESGERPPPAATTLDQGPIGGREYPGYGYGQSSLDRRSPYPRPGDAGNHLDVCGRPVRMTSCEVVATMEDLLAQLRGSRTDLARIVEAAARTELPFIVVPAGAVRAWEEREPSTWDKVRDWLTGQGKAIVERE